MRPGVWLMIYMRWTGLGWLAPVLFVLTLCGGSTIVGSAAPDGFPVPGSVALATLLGGAAHWLVGRSLNSTVTPQGRVWHDRHTYFEAPFQRAAGLYLLVALVATAVAVGQLSSPAVGWAVFLGLPVAGLIVWRRRRRYRLPTATRSRQP